MDTAKRLRTVYISARQKKKLIELMVKHPELISCKVTPDFNYSDSQKLWQTIANQCNAIPGAKKTWKQWKKTWQDIRSKTKKDVRVSGTLPLSIAALTTAEQEALGIKNVSSTTNYQEATEFVPIEQETAQDSFNNEASVASFSEPESPPETKVFTYTSKKDKSNIKVNSSHSDSCVFNCDMLAVQEQKKLQIKEDYLNFKKSYLTQKLQLLKEQTEALKCIAKELSK